MKHTVEYIIRGPCKKMQMCNLLMYQIPSISMNRQSRSFYPKIVVACGCLCKPPERMQESNIIMWLYDRPMHHASMRGAQKLFYVYSNWH